MAKHGEYGSYTDPDKPYYSSADRYNDWLYGGVAPREEETKKKGSSSGSSKKSSGTSDGAYQAMIDAMNAIYAQQQAAAAEAERKQREAAQQAYDRGMQALEGAYGAVSQSAKSNYDAALNTLQANYDASAGKISAEAGDSLQQAYINYMMSKRDLAQQLSAQGLSGGASESAAASVYNTYGTNRNAIVRDRAQNLADLLVQFDSSKSSALQAYNDRMAELEAKRMQYRTELENKLANLVTSAATRNYEAQFGISNDYLSQLLALQKSMLG